ncbi:unnamed protein product [Pleuronectes platessa]|uniref:Uncharacterized protein n=1 Tax=Pleuronectes platessa TaxID=8262 RepID=A0A9N7TL66_PLEPL|nr:unnamed protein product [Pleuronectes platessa]
MGVDVAVVVKGTRRRPGGGEQRIVFSSTQQPGDEPAGEDCVCRLEPGDETGAWKGLLRAECVTAHSVLSDKSVKEVCVNIAEHQEFPPEEADGIKPVSS